MRLLELVPCACTALGPEEKPPAGRRELETAPLSPAPSKRRRRAGYGGSASWRPSLGTIAEVSAAAAAAAGEKEVRPVGRLGKAMAGQTGSASRVLPRWHGDDYRQIGVTATMPTFAPTAFLF
ncbi:uncharacterized protein [Elaeis guineensis]|uniref:Uncharacterized protein LOC105034633 n=1 Tax=Elaeis guineensis var. tenera TaxID=51953 RepID=A0A6I9QG94_ELAGV|nr:uncharacterized protein LOC105034633 [Elaeis guineensis]